MLSIASKSVSLDEAVQAFCAADDVETDRAFFLADIAASKAHANGLARIALEPATRAKILERHADDMIRLYSGH